MCVTNNKFSPDEFTLRQLFAKSSDVLFEEHSFCGHKILFITCNAMIDEGLLNNVVMERLTLFLNQQVDDSFEETIVSELHLPALKQVTDKADLIDSVYTGHVMLYFVEQQLLLKSDIAKIPNRSPEETKIEVPVKGARDNFIEDIATNIALIRKRLPTNSLCVEQLNLGKRTKTSVALLYFDDIVNKETLNNLMMKLQKANIDIVYSGDMLMELTLESSKVFPQHNYTGRPDFAVQSLARGRIIILVDGVAYGIITPINIFMLIKSEDDSENMAIFSSFQRLLRLIAIVIGVFLPAFWLALTTYHQDQLPMQLLATIVNSNTGLPLPTVVEMMLMILMFELFREAGLRLPEAIGGTLSVVGGLIIGDAAIRAGITSPAMVVVIAISVIATFTLINQSLIATASMIRIAAVLLTAFFGLFGFFVALHGTIFYLATLNNIRHPLLKHWT